VSLPITIPVASYLATISSDFKAFFISIGIVAAVGWLAKDHGERYNKLITSNPYSYLDLLDNNQFGTIDEYSRARSIKTMDDIDSRLESKIEEFVND